MSWYTLEAATGRGPSEKAWMRRILAGEASSYVDAFGRRWVWIEEVQAQVSSPALEEAVLPLGREVSSLRRELKELREKIARRRAELVRTAAQTRRPAPPAPPLAPQSGAPASATEPAPSASPAALAETRTHHQILSLIKARWTGSDRELEREAHLPKAFLAKAKKGLRSGPRSAGSWSRLEAFLRAA